MNNFLIFEIRLPQAFVWWIHNNVLASFLLKWYLSTILAYNTYADPNWRQSESVRRIPTGSILEQFITVIYCSIIIWLGVLKMLWLNLKLSNQCVERFSRSVDWIFLRSSEQGSAKVRAARGPEFRARGRAKFLKIPGSGPVPGWDAGLRDPGHPGFFHFVKINQYVSQRYTISFPT